ncbi:MAG: HEAT repeat domain-containing protein [Planctomycetota bacterium]|jgi:HEAT repeat protein
MSFFKRIFSITVPAFLFSMIVFHPSMSAAGEKSLADRYGGAAEEKSNAVLVEMLSFPEYASTARRELILRGEKAVLDVAAAAENADPKIRYYAVAILDAIPGMEAEEAIIKRLSDDNTTVRARAAAALGKYRKEEHIRPLSIALNKETDEIARGSFVMALASIDEARVNKYLVNAFTSKGDFTALGALTARPGVSREPLEEALRTSPNALVRKRAAFALGVIAHKASIQTLSNAATTDADNEVRFAASLALAAVADWEKIKGSLAEKSPAFKANKDVLERGRDPEIIAKLQKEINEKFSKGTSEQVAALKQRLLGNIPSRLLVPVLAGHIDSENASAAAIEILGKWGYPECAAALVKALSSADTGKMKMIIVALGRTGRREVLPLIVRYAASNNAGLRLAAAHALGFLQYFESKLALIPLTSDADANVRAAAIGSLAAFSEKKLESIFTSKMHKSLENTLLPFFTRALFEQNPLIRAAAVEWFGRHCALSDANSVISLIERETHPAVKLEIIKAIDVLTVQSNAMLLSRFLSKEHKPMVRAAAADALGNKMSQTAAFALLKAFNESAGKPSEAVIFLEPLGRTKQTVALAPLLKLLEDQAWQAPSLKVSIVRALGLLRQEPVAAKLAELLKSPDTPANIIEAAVEALGKTPGPAAGVALIGFARDEKAPLNSRRKAIEGLVNSGTQEALKIARAMLAREEFT